MKTFGPDNDAMNDVSLEDDKSDTDSVDTDEGAPASVDDVPELSEQLDEEMVQPLSEDDASKFLTSERGQRTKKGTFQWSC